MDAVDDTDVPGMNNPIPPGGATYQRFLSVMQENGDLKMENVLKDTENVELRARIHRKNAEIIALMEQRNILLQPCSVELVIRPKLVDWVLFDLPFWQAAPCVCFAAGIASLVVLSGTFLLINGGRHLIVYRSIWDALECLDSQTKRLQVDILNRLAMPIKATIVSHIQACIAYGMSMHLVIMALLCMVLVMSGGVISMVLVVSIGYIKLLDGATWLCSRTKKTVETFRDIFKCE